MAGEVPAPRLQDLDCCSAQLQSPRRPPSHCLGRGHPEIAHGRPSGIRPRVVRAPPSHSGKPHSRDGASNEARASPTGCRAQRRAWPRHVAVAGGGGAGLGLARLKDGGFRVIGAFVVVSSCKRASVRRGGVSQLVGSWRSVPGTSRAGQRCPLRQGTNLALVAYDAATTPANA
jgi:hypothetical protein